MPAMNPEQTAVYEAIISGTRGTIVGPLRAALHHPELADKWQQLGELLRFRSNVIARLSELAIVITARHWDSQLEWFIHARVAAEAGIAQATLDKIKTGIRPDFESADEGVVYEFVSELLRLHRVSDATYSRALDLLGIVGVVDLTALVGYYSMVALTLNAHAIPLPEDAPDPLPVAALDLHSAQRP
jgi:4-carboxymuconolactone decarboxylase